MSSARKLSLTQIPQNSQTPQFQPTGAQKFCPKDGDVLYVIADDQAIPQDVTLLRCGHCAGIFAYPDDLIRFKQAQKAKLSYFKFWNIAPSSIRTIALLSFIAVFSFAALSRYIFFQKQSVSTIQASDLIKNVYLNKSGRYLFISFKSQIPLKTQIIFIDKTIGKKIDKTVSDSAKTLHILTATDLNLEDEIYYQIAAEDEKGNEIKTKEIKLEL